MRLRQKKPEGVERPNGSRDARTKIRQAANGYIVQQYPFGCLGGKPRRLEGKPGVWIVPILLTSPGRGAVGEVGMVAVSVSGQEVVGGTPRRQVVAAMKHLRETHADALEAAFHQARTV